MYDDHYDATALTMGEIWQLQKEQKEANKQKKPKAWGFTKKPKAA